MRTRPVGGHDGARPGAVRRGDADRAHDIERLPFADGSFDVVLTCWTLYFMRDIDAALEEIKRTLKPGGRVVAATVAADHYRELGELEAEACRAVGVTPRAGGSERFNMATGLPYMKRHFDHVYAREWRGEMTLPDVETTMRFWELLWAPIEEEDGRDLARPELRRLVEQRTARDGAFRMKRHGGAFVASK
ncbi:MAG: methyltransferase domain-containing protein [Dehalococcoidia bacterium]